ncbi:uncharacterized protein LOC126845764 [Adelges cooleyi]|uniref:uncharacterized protein LOC126845764 n=1 Tax=Adelges cooleyi TaxID=133065 RepID=UPI00217FCA85|nr:uncharacterized protein LOC126845764 [Adelges cooleyi]
MSSCVKVVLTALVAVQVLGAPRVDENLWLTKALATQKSMNESFAKIFTSGVEDAKINTIANKGFADFTKFIKDGIAPTLKKVDANPIYEKVKARLNYWLVELDNLNNGNATDLSKQRGNTAWGKFETAIDRMVKRAPDFKRKIQAARPEVRPVLDDIGNFFMEIINKIGEIAKSVEKQVQDAEKKTVQTKAKGKNL